MAESWVPPVAGEDRGPAETAVIQLAQLVYNHTFDSPDALAAYMRALDDLRVSDIVAACDVCVKHERYFPRPSVLRSYAPSLQPVNESYNGDMRRASRAARYWQDEAGATHVEYRCWHCQDEGFAVVLCTPDGISLGQVIPMAELRQRERAGRVHYRRKRCACQPAQAAKAVA